MALSSDGNTAVVGGPFNDGSAGAGNNGGAAWVFTRSGTSWAQLGSKIAPAVAPSNNSDHWGTAVTLSSDGSTALIGGPNEGPGAGAVWVYTRGASAFTPQQELFPSPVLSLVQFGSSVALSSDGNAALVGAPSDTGGTGGAAWAFTRSGTTWGPGTKIVPTNSPSAVFGSAVALSADGQTALIGAQGMTPDVGAAFIFTQSQGAWKQQQTLTGSGEVGFGFFGTAVALASDGQTAMIGAPSDTSETGAAFAFAPPNPVCNSVSAIAPQGGGSVAVSLSCTLPSGAKPNFTVLGGPSNGTITGLNATTGQLTYTSAAFFSGQDSFTYRVSDQWGVSNPGTATITVPAFAAPVSVPPAPSEAAPARGSSIPLVPVATIGHIQVSGATARISVTCPRQAAGLCHGALTASATTRPPRRAPPASGHERVIVVAEAPYLLHPGAAVRLALTLNRAGVRLLHARYRLRTTVAATGTARAPFAVTYGYMRLTAQISYDATFSAHCCATDSVNDFVVTGIPRGARVRMVCRSGTCTPTARTFHTHGPTLDLGSAVVVKLNPHAIVDFEVTRSHDIGTVVQASNPGAGPVPSRTLCLPPWLHHPAPCP